MSVEGPHLEALGNKPRVKAQSLTWPARNGCSGEVRNQGLSLLEGLETSLALLLLLLAVGVVLRRLGVRARSQLPILARFDQNGFPAASGVHAGNNSLY